MAKGSEAIEQAGIDGLAALGGLASRKALKQLTSPDHLIGLRQKAVIALATLDAEAAARQAIPLLAAKPGTADPTPVFAALLQRKNGSEALTAALAESKLPAEVARVGLRTVRASGREAPALVAALTKAGGLSTGPRVLSSAEMQKLVADISKHGDPAQGEAIYRRKDLACLKCHAIAGAGGQV